MHDGSGRIVVANLSKQFGPVAAVSNLSFTVEPGSVTGFLGPNGSGKTTTLRMILGLVTPSTGTSTINGVPFGELGTPGLVVGAVLEAQGFHPRRSARDHLRVYTAAMGLPDERADQVLQMVGLGGAAGRAAGGFSLGMKQRLALAAAMLGEPQVLVLDEPANGLDPEGIAWLRTFLQAFARGGRTVLISSHILAEVEQLVDQLVIISRGQTVFNGPLAQLRAGQRTRVLVQSADNARLADALRDNGLANVAATPDGRIAVVDATVQQVGDIAAEAGVATYGMQEEHTSLEQLFFQLTAGQYTPPQYQQQGQYPPGGGWGPPTGGQPGYPPTGGQPGYPPTGGQPGYPPTGGQPAYPPAGYPPTGGQPAYPPAGYPPQGQYPQEQYPPGQYPQGQYPQGQYPQGNEYRGR